MCVPLFNSQNEVMTTTGTISIKNTFKPDFFISNLSKGHLTVVWKEGKIMCRDDAEAFVHFIHRGK